jgi:hypothetical protein
MRGLVEFGKMLFLPCNPSIINGRPIEDISQSFAFYVEVNYITSTKIGHCTVVEYNVLSFLKVSGRIIEDLNESSFISCQQQRRSWRWIFYYALRRISALWVSKECIDHQLKKIDQSHRSNGSHETINKFFHMKGFWF